MFSQVMHNLNQYVHSDLKQNSLAKWEPMFVVSFFHPVAIHAAHSTSKLNSQPVSCKFVCGFASLRMRSVEAVFMQ